MVTEHFKITALPNTFTGQKGYPYYKKQTNKQNADSKMIITMMITILRGIILT